MVGRKNDIPNNKPHSEKYTVTGCHRVTLGNKASSDTKIRLAPNTLNLEMLVKNCVS